MRIGQKIQQIRELNNLSQKKLATDLAVTRQAVSRWENGKSIPDIENLMYISNLYGVSLDELIKGDSDLRNKVTADSNAKQWHKLNIGFFLLLLLYIVWIGASQNVWLVGLAVATIGMIATDSWVLGRVKTLRLSKKA